MLTRFGILVVIIRLRANDFTYLYTFTQAVLFGFVSVSLGPSNRSKLYGHFGFLKLVYLNDGFSFREPRIY